MFLIVLLTLWFLFGFGSVLYYLSVCTTVNKVITKYDVYIMLYFVASGIIGSIIYFLFQKGNGDRVIWRKKKK